MVQFGGISGEHLRQFIARIEKLEEEKRDVMENIRDVYAEAKSAGFDPKIMRKVVGLRKLDENKRQEQEEVLDIYKHALGMIAEFAASDESEAA